MISLWKKIQPWLVKNKHKIELFFLSLYSPELNPVERVWKNTRYSATHNWYFPTLDSLLFGIKQRLDQRRQPNTELKSLCAINYDVYYRIDNLSYHLKIRDYFFQCKNSLSLRDITP